jgi:hypothetical protein
MYLALFLTPWILMYAASTFVMNHREWFRGDPPPAPRWETAAKLSYLGKTDIEKPRELAVRILSDLELSGAHTARVRDGKLEINRFDPVRPLRLTYSPSEQTVRIERTVFEGAEFLERLHRRRGFQQDYAADVSWAVIVDGVIAAIVFWILSGFWMWWELRITRLWGAAFATAGLAVFAILVAVL